MSESAYEVGRELRYSGEAERVSDGQPVDIEGRFVVVERTSDRALLEDVRAAQFVSENEHERDLHRYSVPLSAPAG